MKREIREIFVSDGYRHVLDDEVNPDIPLALDFCGAEKCKPGHSFGPVERDVNLIHAVTKGRGILRCRGQEWRIESDSLFVIHAGEEIYYRADRDDPWTYYWIGFHGTAAEDHIRHVGFRRDMPVVRVSNMEEITDLIEQMMGCDELDQVGFMMRTGILYQVFSYMMKNADTNRDYALDFMSASSYEEYAIRYIRMHFREKLKISELAEKIGISRGYLVRVFRDATSMSPQEYLIHTRLWHSVHALAHTNGSVNDIAFHSGYADALAFSKAFKSHFGLTPTQFREMYLNKEIVEEDLLNEYRSAKDRHQEP